MYPGLMRSYRRPNARRAHCRARRLRLGPQSRSLHCERLEDRRLLHGVTLLTHGFEFSSAAENLTWLDHMASAVANDVATSNHGSSSSVAQFRMTVAEVNNNPAVTGWAFAGNFAGSGPAASFDLRNSLGAEAVITLDWSAVAGLSFVSTQTVAQAFTNYLSGTA